MRTLAEIATDMRNVQNQAAEAHMDSCDPYLPHWERDFDEEEFDTKYSTLYREFEQTLGIKDLDDFVTSTDAILGMVHKGLELKQLQNNYWDVQEYLECCDNPTIEELTDIVNNMKHY